jgi:HEAT repeat protein
VADPEPQIKKAAADALQRAGAQPAVSLALLKSNDNALRVVAAKAIAASGKCDQEAIGLLIAAMKDAHAGVRDDSTTALVRLGKTAIPALSESAQGGDKAAIKVIGRMGMPGVASLLELANFKDLPVRLAAIEVLGELQTFPPTYLPALRKLAQEDRQVEVRDAAMRVMLRMELRNPNPNSRALDVDLLLRGLQDKDWASRRESSTILAGLKGAAVPGMVEKLVEIVEKNPDAAIRSETIHTLGMIGPRAAGAVKPLIDLVRSDKAENVPLRACALAALDRMHPEADAGLLGILIDADVPLQVAVLQMLRTEQVKTAKDLIVDMLRSKNPEIRIASAQALGKLGSPIAKDLAPLLEDKEGDIRAAALLAMEDFATAETLGKYLRDEKLAVRETAARALAKKGARAHGVLAEALSSKDYRVQVAAANAIAAMDNRDGVDDRADALLSDLIVVFLAKGARDPELQAAARAIHGINPILAARQIAAKAEVPDLIEMLKRSAPEVRELACLALAEKGPDAAVALPALTDLLKQPTTDVIVLAAAARAVQVISPPRKLGVNENDDRLPPDVGLRLAKGTHAKSTQLREEIMESLQKQFSPTRDNSAEVILAALHLGQRTDDVNSWLIDFADSTDLSDAASPNFVRILALYHANKMAAARLTPAAELALKEQFWRYLKNRGPLVNSPANLKVSLTAVLEKEELVARITSYLAMEVMMDDPAFKDRFLANRTLQDLHQGWTVWWREWAKDRAMRGLWSEMGWPAHQMVIWPCLLNMYDCAEDAVVKQQFKMLLDLTAIEEEQISIHGTRAGRRGKSNGVGSGLDPWKDVLQGQRPRRTGEADSGLAGIVWTSAYQLPTAAILLRQLERPVPSYTITNRVVTPFSGTNRPAGNVVAHVTPHYVLGSQFSPIAGTMEPVGNWHRLVFDDMKAIFYPLTAGERLHFQHDNICISTWNGIAVEPQMIHFSSGLKQVEKDGWLFLSNGPAFAAIYVENGYDLERAPVKPARPGLDTITFKEPRAIVVLQAGDVHKFGSFEKFQEAILKAPLKISQASVHYTGPQAEAVEFFRRGNAVVAKAAPPKGNMTYDSPYLRGEAGQPRITVRFGSYSAVYDFENNAITEGK